MKKPEELIELLSILAKENARSSVVTTPDSSATVYIRGQEMPLTAKECQLLLHDTSSVNRFAEALPQVRSANLELHDVVLGEDAMSALEAHFSTVDDI